MIDYDLGGLRAEPITRSPTGWPPFIRAAFRSAGADPTIGSRLKGILALAGVVDVEGFAIAQYLAC